MKKFILIVTTVVFLFAIEQDANAQCSMCKAAVESNVKSNGNFVGKGLNHGILYLMSIPYILGAVGFGIYYFNRKKKM
ncbi:MAG: hypothetical protein ABI723_23510 [Bacteroidia bacterium]